MFFATLFDKNYIARAELMIESLVHSMGEEFSKMFVLCLDQEVGNYFDNHPKIECVPLYLLEEKFPSLSEAKSNRSFVEYIFTLSPFFPLFILQNYPSVKRITTLDSDLFFFSSPSTFLKALGNEKIGITAHNFPKDLGHLNRYGKFNVSFQSFPNSELGLQCLRDWADDCFQYCGDDLDHQGRFADQKYLDTWQERYGQVEAFPSPEIGLAPWNIHAYELDFNSNLLKIREKQVIFYHFQGIRVKSKRHFHLGLFRYHEGKPSKSTIKFYLFYLEKLVRKSRYTDAKIKRLQNTSSANNHSFMLDFKFEPVLVKSGPFFKYLDLRKVVDFAEKKLKITRWQN